MPHRLVCVLLLGYWLIAAVGLVSRDLLPELSVGSPPDLRSIASAGEDAPPAHWNIQVVDNPNDPGSARSVGQAVTESTRKADGWVEMSSKVSFDSGRLLGGLFKRVNSAATADGQVEFDSVYEVDPSGNLHSFRAEVRMPSQLGLAWKLEGKLNKRSVMEVESTGPLELLNRKLTFDYKAQGVVQSRFGPLDRLPGLHVGQRWDERIVDPLAGQVETVRAEVTRKTVIHWGRSPVSAYEVVHKSKAVSARTWVRSDGLVLRQEVVLPLLRLVLERQPEREGGPHETGSEAASPTGPR